MSSYGDRGKVAGTGSRIAAMLAEGESTACDAVVQEYEQLYWGNITFVDEPALVGAMDTLRHEIRYLDPYRDPYL